MHYCRFICSLNQVLNIIKPLQNHVLGSAVFVGRTPKILATRDARPTENVYIPFPTVPVTSALHLLLRFIDAQVTGNIFVNLLQQTISHFIWDQQLQKLDISVAPNILAVDYLVFPCQQVSLSTVGFCRRAVRLQFLNARFFSA